jgi:DNA-binding protein H-NS
LDLIGDQQMSKLSKWLKKAEQAVSNAIPHQHSADRRAANQAVAEQMEYYKTAKETMTKESDRVEAERNRTNAKIDKKQIKSARHAYRAPGFMDEASTGYSDTLG